MTTCVESERVREERLQVEERQAMMRRRYRRLPVPSVARQAEVDGGDWWRLDLSDDDRATAAYLSAHAEALDMDAHLVGCVRELARGGAADRDNLTAEDMRRGARLLHAERMEGLLAGQAWLETLPDVWVR